jgi:hypothetical protein
LRLKKKYFLFWNICHYFILVFQVFVTSVYVFERFWYASVALSASHVDLVEDLCLVTLRQQLAACIVIEIVFVELAKSGISCAAYFNIIDSADFKVGFVADICGFIHNFVAKIFLIFPFQWLSKQLVLFLLPLTSSLEKANHPLPNPNLLRHFLNQFRRL